MKKRWSRLWAIAMAFLLSASGPAVAADAIRAYIGFPPEVGEALSKMIEERLGIQVKHTLLSFEETWARLAAEAPRFNADMIISTGAVQAMEGKRKGYYQAYKSPVWNDIDPAFKDRDGFFIALGTFSFLLVGNKNNLSKKGYGMPQSWSDLLDPKWKGKIVAPSPRASGTAFMINYAFLQLYGQEEGWKFLEELDKNIALYTGSGSAPAELVGRGEYLLGITSDENVLKRIKDGYPLAFAAPGEGIGYEGNYCMILKGARNPASCRKVIDFLGTREVSELIASFGYMPPRREIPSALYGTAEPIFMKIDLQSAVKDRPKMVASWKKKFAMKEQAKKARDGAAAKPKTVRKKAIVAH